jgi:hypothetical protein
MALLKKSLPASSVAGNQVQLVSSLTGAVATGTTVLPHDDTIPQNTEGTEFLSLAITPASTSNKLKISICIFGAYSVNGHLTAALFQDSTANALACASVFVGTANAMTMFTFDHVMTAGTTSATTFKVRIGCNNAGTFTLNGWGGTRYMGDVHSSSLIIEEIKA